jgi:predicted glycosyltransferase
MSLRVQIVVTHLLGAGHLTRAAALARAFAARGHSVTLVSGGMPAQVGPVKGVTFVQLPALRTSGVDFKALLDPGGRPIDAAYLAGRRRHLLEAFEETRPDVLVTELFPFGRRILAEEFLAVVEAARASRPRPLVACSIRDVLVAPTRPGRVEETHERLGRLYDLVLVHGDPELVPLEASWPVADTIRPLLAYTGYVDEGAPGAAAGPRSGIVVSGGSSAASLPLYRCALEAAQQVTRVSWRVLVGRGVPEADLEAFRTAAPAHVAVERARSDFRDLLGGAELSVSQAGYNTCVDLLRTGPFPILVPFEAGSETEQRLRADRLAALGAAAVIPEAELSVERLADAVRRNLGSAAARRLSVDLGGASRTVDIVEGFVLAAPASRAGLDWTPLDDGLREAAELGRTIRFWWRDDDATAASRALSRLLGLSRSHDAPVALAVIPGKIETSLGEALSDAPAAAALVHGLRHANHAPGGEKKAEFGPHRPRTLMAKEAADALRVGAAYLGPRLLPVFVPPWNRVDPGLLPHLRQAGYRAISTFRDRDRAEPEPGLVQVNTHLDPIDWRGSRSLADPAALVRELASLVARRLRDPCDAGEPIGLLTHHLAHDESVWSFCEALMERLRRNNIRLEAAAGLFCCENRIVGER